MSVKIAAFSKELFKNYHLYDNIPTDSTAAWVSTATYAANDKRQFGGCIFISAANNNTGNEPVPYTDTQYWVYEQETNEKKYLNGKSSRKSRNESTTETMLIKYAADGITFFAIGGLIGNYATVKLANSEDESEIYEEYLIQMDDIFNVHNDFELIYPYGVKRGVAELFATVPIRYGQTLVVEIFPKTEGDENGTGIGLFSFGRTEEIGCLQYGMSVVTSPSETVTRDVEDNIDTVQKNGTVRITYPILIQELVSDGKMSELTRVEEVLGRNRGIPIVIFGDDNVTFAQNFGLFREVEIRWENGHVNETSIILDALA